MLDPAHLKALQERHKALNLSRFIRYWVLRQSKTTRLVFQAELVENPGNPDASVHGTFFFERKSTKASWTAVESILLSSLKAGDGVKLELKSAEVLALYEHLHRQLGKKPTFEEQVKLLAETLPGSKKLTSEDAGVLGSLVTWALNIPDGLNAVVQGITALDTQAMANLSASVQLANLTELLTQLETNKANENEGFWQHLLSSRPVLLQQLFEFPVTIVQGKAYVGGKSISNDGGKVVDFLLKNSITGNASLVEIKTPLTKLLHSQQYRADVFAISADLAGAVAQILTYRDTLQKCFHHLGQPTNRFDAFEPKCVVIAGQAAEVCTEAKRRSFELLRAQLNGVRIVTFDELEMRLRSLISLLRGGDSV